MAIVSIEGLTKAYGSRPPVLRDVALEIAPGVTGLLGPNGAGKSTMLQCILGLLRGWEGRIQVLGLDAARDGRALRRRVGFMPETDAYLPDMTGLRAVRYLGQLTGMPHAEALRRAHEVLFHVGLGEAIYRHVREYSTGMRQRFKLAQALVHDPELIFLDEPLSGLDPEGREELLDLIRDLADAHGKHIVWSSHLLPDVQKVADAVAILKDGRSRGVHRLEDLAPRVGMVAVESEGDATVFAANLETAGVGVARRNRPGDALAGSALTTTWELTLPEAFDQARLFTIARESESRLRRVEPMREDLESIFLRVLDDDTQATGEAS